MWNIVGEKEKAEVTRFRSSFGLKGRAKRNKKGRMLEMKGTDPEKRRRA